MRGCAPKVSIPLEGKVPWGDIPSFSNRLCNAYGRDAREIGKLWEMGALRLGKLALLAVLGPFAGRRQFRAHP